ncbi:MAG: hypothetical protein Q8L14_11670 [Myxococcales bacterium]|nr:hypothetical protein [Myxococcales bacterium]
MTEHPSFLALDRHALGEPTADVILHVAGCLTCRAHVEAVMVAAPIPARVLELRQAPAPRWWRAPWLRLAVPLYLVLAIPFAAATHWAVGRYVAKQHTRTAFTVKGAPTAAAWVKRGDTVTLWRGEPLGPGDAVRFQVVLEHFTRVTVIDATSKTVLYEAAVTKETTTPAWTLDAAPGGDVVWVVLSNEAVTPAIVDTCDGGSVWCRRFELRSGGK